MISVALGPGECHGGVAVVLRGELEVAGAASAAAVVRAGAACSDEVVAGLAGPEFISRSGLRVLQRVRMLPPGGRADGWVPHPHRCDMISAGSSVLTRGRYAAASRALAPRPARRPSRGAAVSQSDATGVAAGGSLRRGKLTQFASYVRASRLGGQRPLAEGCPAGSAPPAGGRCRRTCARLRPRPDAGAGRATDALAR